MGIPKPQHGALKHAEGLDLVRNAEWVLVSDLDEFVSIQVGDGGLDALIKAAGSPEIISMQWRLFASSNIERRSRAFGPVVNVDQLVKEMIQNDETKEPFA